MLSWPCIIVYMLVLVFVCYLWERHIVPLCKLFTVCEFALCQCSICMLYVSLSVKASTLLENIIHRIVLYCSLYCGFWVTVASYNAPWLYCWALCWVNVESNRWFSHRSICLCWVGAFDSSPAIYQNCWVDTLQWGHPGQRAAVKLIFLGQLTKNPNESSRTFLINRQGVKLLQAFGRCKRHVLCCMVCMFVLLRS